MTYNEALQRIQDAAKDKKLKLNLSGLELDLLPSEIEKLINLTELDLSNNELKSFPLEIIKLTNLKTLNLSGNKKLKSLPSDIVNLKKLTTLSMSRNELELLPPEILNLTNLESLQLSNNKLKSLPPGIENLNNLNKFGLDFNELESLPREIGKLTKLNIFLLTSNLLKSLPPEIANLNNLKDIKIKDNLLDPIPPDLDDTGMILAFYGNEKLMDLYKILQRKEEKIREREKELEERESEKWKKEIKDTLVAAKENLQKYHKNNLFQINFIFWLSIGVIIIGFIFILLGIKLGGELNSVATIGTIAGIITEFIGATFLFIYRSTIQQASTYYKTLERLNSFGVALEIIYTISDESKELKDKTKAEIIKLLLSIPETK